MGNTALSLEYEAPELLGLSKDNLPLLIMVAFKGRFVT